MNHTQLGIDSSGLHLGANAPEPLKAGLAQSLEWDGKDDDGKQVYGGPLAAAKPSGEAGFKVRVGLGLKASWGGLAFAEPGKSGPNMLEGLVAGLAVGPDGRVYVGQPHHYMFHGMVMKTLVFRRDGAYERTLMPFPPHLPMERLKATGAFINSFGAVNPRQGPYVNRQLWFYPVYKVMFQTPAVMPEGQIYMAGVGDKGAGVLTVIDTEGGVPAESYGGPALGVNWLDSPFLAPATDGKSVYAARCGPANGKVSHAVYRIRVPERGPAEPFFGEPATAGNDEKHLSDPRALALDGQGQVFIADSGNNRVVVVKEADGSFVGALPVEGPTWVGVHRKTGAVYVYGKAGRVIKFSSWKDAKEQASLAVPPMKDPLYRRTEPALALDGLAEPAVLWLGLGNYPTKNVSFVRCVDEGGKFSDPAQAGYYTWEHGVTMPPARVDPTHRMVLGLMSGMQILDEASGQVRTIKGQAAKRPCRMDRDGNLYAPTAGEPLRRFDRDGNPKPFAATLNDPILKGDLPVGHRGNSSWERDFWIDRKGDIYVNRTGAAYHGLQTLEVFDQSGNLKRVALPSVTDGMYGPRVDAKGNIVILDIAKPPDQPYPKEFAGIDPAMYNWFYGSVIKFGPRGGAIWAHNDTSSPVEYENWRAYYRILDLRTTGGCLTGKIPPPRWFDGVPAFLTVPGRPGALVDADKHKTATIRMKNGSDGTNATFGIGRELVSGLPVKTIGIKPNSDFTEYTFDLSGSKDWKGMVSSVYISPSDTRKEGTFAVDWIKIGTGADQKVWNFDAEDSADKRLSEDMKKDEVVASHYLPKGSTLQGALWHRQGFSAISAQGNGGRLCHCNGTDFDMDDFGRLYVGDSLRFRVGVLDANGNEIASIGAYGNQDFSGSDSYVMDPAGKFLRPRKADDPKDLASPFAKPDVAFAWINGVAVTDRHAYVTDLINKRILRVKLEYAATETAAVP